MAKRGRNLKLSNCLVDIENGLFVEQTKDGDLVYKIDDILLNFNGLSGVNINITWAEDIEPDGNEY